MTEKSKHPQSRLLLAEGETWSQVKHRLTEQVRHHCFHNYYASPFFFMSTQYDLQDSMLSFLFMINFK